MDFVFDREVVNDHTGSEELETVSILCETTQRYSGNPSFLAIRNISHKGIYNT